jgi:hypothetical protein
MLPQRKLWLQGAEKVDQVGKQEIQAEFYLGYSWKAVCV